MVQRGRGQLLCQLGLRPLGANEADAETALDADPCRRPLALYLGTDGKAETPLHTSSLPDLLQWKAQKYFDRSRLAEYRPAEVYPNVRKEVLLNGTVQQGWMQRVPYATVQRVISFAEHKKYRQHSMPNRTEQDPVRFAGLKPVEATIEVETECAKTISKHLIGIFFEDINYAADGDCMPSWYRTATSSIRLRTVHTKVGTAHMPGR